jgi:hypothetical protein
MSSLNKLQISTRKKKKNHNNNIPKGSEAMHGGHLDDKGKHVVHKGVQSLQEEGGSVFPEKKKKKKKN